MNLEECLPSLGSTTKTTTSNTKFLPNASKNNNLGPIVNMDPCDLRNQNWHNFALSK